MSSALFGSYVDQPRFMVTINDDKVDEVTTVTVNNNNYYKPDSFSATIYYNADAEYPPSWWSAITTKVDASNTTVDDTGNTTDLTAAIVIIYFGFLQPNQSTENIEWRQMLVGQIDGLEIDGDNFRIDIVGRDLSSRLVDTKTTQTYSNKTSSQIAIMLASAHGLKYQVTPTTTLVGRYYQSQHDQIKMDNFTRITTDWDLMVYLAQQETDTNGNPFAVYMDGSTLVFGPRFNSTNPPFGIYYSFNKNAPSNATVSKLRMKWVLTLAKDITVIVKSWNSYHEREFTRTARSNHSGRSGSASGVTGQQYVVVIPNLTSDQALQRAQAILAQQSLHERNIDFEMPYNFLLTPRDRIQLGGTNTDFDTIYYIDEIVRTMGIGKNQRQWIKCRNSRPGYEVTVG